MISARDNYREFLLGHSLQANPPTTNDRAFHFSQGDSYDRGYIDGSIAGSGLRSVDDRILWGAFKFPSKVSHIDFYLQNTSGYPIDAHAGTEGAAVYISFKDDKKFSSPLLIPSFSNFNTYAYGTNRPYPFDWKGSWNIVCSEIKVFICWAQATTGILFPTTFFNAALSDPIWTGSGNAMGDLSIQGTI